MNLHNIWNFVTCTVQVKGSCVALACYDQEQKIMCKRTSPHNSRGLLFVLLLFEKMRV